jgi:hypothetical protein
MPRKKKCPKCGTNMDGPKYDYEDVIVTGGKIVWFALYSCPECMELVQRNLKPWEVKRLPKKILERGPKSGITGPLKDSIKVSKPSKIVPEGEQIIPCGTPCESTTLKAERIELLTTPFFVVEKTPEAEDELKEFGRKLQECPEVWKFEFKETSPSHVPNVLEVHIRPESRPPYKQIEAVLGQYPMWYEPISEMNFRKVGKWNVVPIIGNPHKIVRV